MQFPFAVSAEGEKLTLFVGNLHPDIQHNYLFQLFSPYGRITSSRVMRDMYSGESREFGFVSFSRPEEAKRAFEELNGHEVFGRELRVMYKKRIRDLNENANVMVRNVDGKMKTRQLFEECKKVGTVLSLVLFNDKPDRTDVGGCGYVQFESETEAAKFIEEYNGKVLCDRELVVEKYIPARMRTKPETKNVYIKNFPAGWDEARVNRFIDESLKTLGEVSCSGVYSKHGSFYAFVAYEKVEDARKAIETFNGWREDGQSGEPLYVGLALSKKERLKQITNEKLLKKNETNLYIRSVRSEVTEEEVRTAFEKYGKITSIFLKTWENPHPTEPTAPAAPKKLQFGFINFENPEEALKAHTSYKTDATIKAFIDPSETRDFLFFAQPKRIREQYLRVQRNNYALMMAVKAHRMMAGFQNMSHMRGPPRRGKRPQQNNYAPPAINLLPPTTTLFTSSSSRTPTPQKSEYENQTPLQKLEQAADEAAFVKLVRAEPAVFTGLDADKQKKLVGHWMYNRVEKNTALKELVPKITGMLIDPEVIDFDEQFEILVNDEMLQERVQEAIEILTNPQE